MKLPKVIQIFFHDEDNNKDIAHDYYLNSSWIIDLCDEFGYMRLGDRIKRALEAKRQECIKRYGSEWGKSVVNPEKKKKRHRKDARKDAQGYK